MASTPLIAITGLLSGFALGFFGPTLLAASTRPAAISPPEAQAELSEALDEFDRLDRVAAMGSALSRTPSGGIDGVRAAVEQAPLNGGDIEYLLFVGWWAGFEPEAAAQWLNRNPQAGSHRVIIEELYRTWGRRDPESALAAVPKLRYVGHRARARATILGAVDSADQPRILSLLQEIPPGATRKAAVVAAVSGRIGVGDDTQAAERWVGDMERLAREAGDDALASEIQLASVDVLASIDPVQAAEWWDGWAGSSGLELPPPVAEEIASTWAKQDPRAAMEWVAGLPPGKARDRAVSKAYFEWLVVDLAGAREWGSRESAAPSRWAEPAIRTYVVLVGVEDPMSGIALVPNLSNEALRREALLQIVRRWATKDPASALAWIETTDLQPDLEAELRSAAGVQQSLPAQQPPVPSS